MRDKIQPGSYFEYRPGLRQFPRWEGVRHDYDPGSLPPNALALAVNVRFDPSGVRTRSGIRPIATLPTLSPTSVWTGNGGVPPQEQVYWLGTHHMQSRAPRLWISSPGCLGPTAPSGGFIRWYNPDKSPEVQAAGNFVAELDRLPPIAPYDGEMIFGDWAVLQRPNVLETARAESVQLGNRESYTEQVVGYTGRDITAMQEFDGKLFLALHDPADVASAVGYWDGLSRVTDDLVTGADYGVNFCVWRDTKLVMLQHGSNAVRIRDLSGTWATVVLPKVIDNDYKNSMVEFRDEIYIAPGDEFIYKISDFESPTASTVHTLPVIGNDTTVRSVAVLGDNLYFLYNVWSGGVYHGLLGLYEPDLVAGNWIENYSGLVGAGPAYLLPPGATTMVPYRNRLYVGGGSSQVVTHTLINDPTSEWYIAVGTVANQGVSALRVG